MPSKSFSTIDDAVKYAESLKDRKLSGEFASLNFSGSATGKLNEFRVLLWERGTEKFKSVGCVTDDVMPKSSNKTNKTKSVNGIFAKVTKDKVNIFKSLAKGTLILLNVTEREGKFYPEAVSKA